MVAMRESRGGSQVAGLAASLALTASFDMSALFLGRIPALVYP